MLLLHPSDYRVMPWKNGGGSTTEIAIEPKQADVADPFLWRVSSAKIAASGPFSSFPGYLRSLVLLEGVGLLLDIEGNQGKARLRLKDIRQPVVFSGDDTVHATLIQGPCIDFGVISDPSRVRVAVRVLTLGPETTSLTSSYRAQCALPLTTFAELEPIASTTLLFAPRGLVHVDSLDVELGPMDTLYSNGASGAFREGTTLDLHGSAQDTPLVVVQFWPVVAPQHEGAHAQGNSHG